MHQHYGQIHKTGNSFAFPDFLIIGPFSFRPLPVAGSMDKKMPSELQGLEKGNSHTLVHKSAPEVGECGLAGC